MASPQQARTSLATPDRRFFLSWLTSLGSGLVLSEHGLKGENRSEPSYRFRTPECEVRMSVQFLANSSIEGFHFRDRLTNRTFCLSANGREDHGCLERFVGAMAIARYAFRSQRRSAAPLNLRERVVIIDNDSGMSPPPPFERVLTVEREMASDIQAFGYNADDAQRTAFRNKPAWRILRQDLYLNGRTTAFLIVHWKHTLDVISLVDVIPGDDTEWIR
jgi:hypothetical protein